MSLLRAMFLAGLLVTPACSKNAARSAEGNPARAASAPAPAPRPGDSNNPGYLSLTLECTRATAPPRPLGERAIVSRAVNYEDFGPGSPVRPAQQTIRRESGPLEGGSASPTPEARAEIYRLALAALNQLPITAELTAPSAESCRLQLYRVSLQIDTRVNLPSKHPVLAELVRALAQMLPNRP